VSHPLLELDAFGLVPKTWTGPFTRRRFGREGTAPLKDIVGALRETYCRAIGVEYMHLQDPEERIWLQEQMEPSRNRPELTAPTGTASSTRNSLLRRRCSSSSSTRNTSA
jgi:2-oxoglutarate dehydrogenase E1 component